MSGKCSNMCCWCPTDTLTWNKLRGAIKYQLEDNAGVEGDHKNKKDCFSDSREYLHYRWMLAFKHRPLAYCRCTFLNKYSIEILLYFYHIQCLSK